MVTETQFTIWVSVQSGSIARTSDFHYYKFETSSLYTLSLPPFNHPQQREHNWLILTTGGHFFLITTGGQTWYHYNSISWTIWNLIFILHYCADPKIMERYSESYIIFQQHQKTESTLLKLIFINQRHYKKICENDWHNEVITLCKTSRN